MRRKVFRLCTTNQIRGRKPNEEGSIQQIRLLSLLSWLPDEDDDGVLRMSAALSHYKLFQHKKRAQQLNAIDFQQNRVESMTQTLKSETRDDLSTFGTLLLHMFHSSSTSESNPFSNTLFVQVRVPLCSAAAAVLPSPSVIHQIGCGSNYLFAH